LFAYGEKMGETYVEWKPNIKFHMVPGYSKMAWLDIWIPYSKLQYS
jgi:hypothetical protein